jgi:hypothetical protein
MRRHLRETQKENGVGQLEAARLIKSISSRCSIRCRTYVLCVGLVRPSRSMASINRSSRSRSRLRPTIGSRIGCSLAVRPVTEHGLRTWMSAKAPLLSTIPILMDSDCLSRLRLGALLRQQQARMRRRFPRRALHRPRLHQGRGDYPQSPRMQCIAGDECARQFRQMEPARESESTAPSFFRRINRNDAAAERFSLGVPETVRFD